ncbi:MAG: hypothetical protein PHO92_04920 [Candidatus Peribacteraceae bacterium]|nr:hypothetical protein [Candidatus Peribacteraceae bacterium]
MTSPENPSAGLERRESAPPLHETLNAFEAVLGPDVKDLPAEISTEWIHKELQDITQDGRVDTYNEQSRYNELFYRQAVLERHKDLQSKKNEQKSLDPVKLQELIVAEQAVAYHVYFREAQNHVLDVLRRYETLRKNVPHVPAKILQMEADTQRFVAALQQATQERVAHSNVLLRDPHASLIRANQLNQRIIDILAGEHGLHGIERGYVPQKMFLELLKFEYKRLLDQQKEIARDPALITTRTEMQNLELKHTLAEEKKGEFTEEDKARYDELQSRIKAVDAQFKALGGKRREITEQIITLTDELGASNIQQEEVASIQEQFGKKFSFEGVQGVNPLTTPPDVRTAIAANMEKRKAHHLHQMDNFLTSVETDVLAKGLGVRMEQLWNTNGREAVRLITHRMAAFFTFAVPEVFGLHEAAKDALTAPLDEALGWPAGKDSWEELTDDEKQIVREKATSILGLIEQFDRMKITRFRETIALVQKMKPASAFTLEDVKFDEAGQAILPQERVTSGTIDELISRHGGAMVYLMLMRQLQEDFGTDQPPQGFMGAYADFLHQVDTNIDVHLDTGRALHILGKRYDDLMKWLLLAAGAGLVIGVAGTVAVIKMTGKTIRMTAKGLWRGTKGMARLSGKLMRSPGAGVAGVGAAVEAVPAAAEAATKTLPSTASKTLIKYLGPTAIVLTAWEMKNAIQLAASLEKLPDLKAVDAAIELMETHPLINREAPQYQRDLHLLYQRRQLIAMRDVLENMAVTLDAGAKEDDPDRASTLVQRGKKLAGFARQQDRDLHLRFPITDHMFRGRNDPEGVLRVDYTSLNGAREEGMRNAERLDRRMSMGNLFGPKKSLSEAMDDLPATDFSALKTEYEKFMEDVAAYMGKREAPKRESSKEYLEKLDRENRDRSD